MPIPTIDTFPSSMNDFWQSHMYLLYLTTTCAVVYIVWTLKLWKAIIETGLKELRDNHHNLEIKLPIEYMRIEACEKENIKRERDIREIKEMLNKIFDKLDGKADKL